MNVLAACKPMTRDEMAARVAHDIPEGWYVNLGIGAPLKVADHVPQSAKSFSIPRTAFSAWARRRSRMRSIAG